MEVHVVSATAQRFNGQTYYLCGDYFQPKLQGEVQNKEAAQ